MPCKCGMSDQQLIESLKNDIHWIDIRYAVDKIIEVLLLPRRLEQIEMDEDQAKKALLKLVEHKLYGCDEDGQKN